LVPADAQSISVLVPSGQNGAYTAATVVTLNGVNIPLVAIAGDRITGNISAFAGTVSELTISTINAGAWLYFDDIQFSSSAVPEPSTLALLGYGASLLGMRPGRRNFRRRWGQTSLFLLLAFSPASLGLLRRGF
jgi:hypothetical protein